MKDLKQKTFAEFIITVFAGWIGVHKFKQGKVGIGILYLFTFGLFYVGWIYDIIQAWKTYKYACRVQPQSCVFGVAPAPAIVPAANVAPAPAAQKKSVPDGEKNYNLFEDVTDGAVLCYEYEESLCLLDGAFDYIPGNGGKPLTFKQEPENLHDEKAVAVYLNVVKIGYIYRGTVQDMFNDYMKRGWRVFGYLNKYSVCDNKATYKIGFYKPLDIFESKRFSLSKIKKKIDEYTTREDNLLNCDEGDALTIEYEVADDCFVVFNDLYEEVGELPKSAANFINENDHKKIVCILEACEEDDDGKTKAQVTVYLVK